MQPPVPTTIETPRLLLRPMVADDFDALLGIFGDPKVMAAFSEEPFTHQQMRYWLERNLRHQEEFGYGLFSVICKADDLLIGDCGLERMEVEGRSVAELGYDFRSDAWNKGYATEAARAVRDYAFNTLDLAELISLVRQTNGASARVAEKVGMRQAGEFERYGARYWRYELAREEAQPSSK